MFSSGSSGFKIFTGIPNLLTLESKDRLSANITSTLEINLLSLVKSTVWFKSRLNGEFCDSNFLNAAMKLLKTFSVCWRQSLSLNSSSLLCNIVDISIKTSAKCLYVAVSSTPICLKKFGNFPASVAGSCITNGSKISLELSNMLIE